MDKHVFFSWLAEVHLRKETQGIELPNLPALASFVTFSNEFCWSDPCYQEVESLGKATGIHFVDFLQQYHDSKSTRGSAPAHPILLDNVTEDTGESKPWSYSFRTSDCSSLETHLDAATSVYLSASECSSLETHFDATTSVFLSASEGSVTALN